MQKDTLNLAKINEYAYKLANSNPDSALLLLNAQLGWCKAAGFKKGEVDATKLLGNALQTQGKFDSALLYFSTANAMAIQYKQPDLQPGIFNNIGLVYTNKGNYAEALRYFHEALKALPPGREFIQTATINNIGNVYFFQGKMELAVQQYAQMLAIAQQHNLLNALTLAHSNLGEAFLMQEKWEKATAHLDTAFGMAMQEGDANLLVAVSKNLAKIYAKTGKAELAMNTYQQVIALAQEKNYAVPGAQARVGLGQLFLQQQKIPQAMQQADTVLMLANKMGQPQLLRDAHQILYETHTRTNRFEDALYHYKQFRYFSDSLINIQHEREIATLQASYSFAQTEAQLREKNSQQRWWLFSALAGMTSIGIIAFLINKNKRKLHQAYARLHDKNEELDWQKKEVEKAMEALKNTQKQLIHSEKMASLGQMTAGIAHELKNPLNFINNFSEVSLELLEEWQTEQPNAPDQNENELLAELIQSLTANLQKINVHGKRADLVIQSMLQHSRKTTGKKEPTDLNHLIEQSLHLAYEGYKSTHKDFALLTEFRKIPNLPLIPLIPQDIGRVLLNLLNNAFDALHKHTGIKPSAFTPKVEISLQLLQNNVRIIIQDNGPGIPDDVKDKIFQPFFTTKPTGQGTGLGLSLSYDIVKAHGGELSVQSASGEGTAFTIQLPTT